MHMTEPTTHCAVKRHRCGWCWQFIEAGESYTRYRWFSDCEANTIKMHPECFGAMQDAALEEGGTIEWTPGQERPARPAAVPQGTNDPHNSRT